MARFRFRLQPLLHYREYRTEQAKHELARLSAEEQTLRAAIEQLRERMRALEVHSDRTPAHQLQVFDAHRQHLAEQIRTLERELDFLSIERERAELRLVERMQEQDVLERLRQRRYEEYVLEERRDEQRQIDDIAGRRHQTA